MPPPPPPPPPPAFGNAAGPSAISAKPLDRSALLGEIRGGRMLKKVETNDRSTPLIDSKKSSNTNNAGGVSGGGVSQMGASKANGPSNGPPLALGGLFAQGMPKLRPTGRGTVSATQNQLSSPSSKSQEQHSRSHPPSPISTIRNGPTSTSRTFNTLAGRKDVQRSDSSISSGYNSAGSQRRSPFPNDISPTPSNNRGPPPPPPPPSASQKPQLVNTNSYTNGSPQQMDTKPPPPSKPPGVTRSSSQTNLNGVIINRPVQRSAAPTSRPPPPPKVGSVTIGGVPPALPSKPPNLARRKSFGGPDLRNGMSFLHNQQQQNRQQQSHYNKASGPPPPPRNISVPDSLNNLQDQQNRIPPPTLPPPPPPPSSAKMNVPQSNMLLGRSLPNLAPAPPLKPPSVRPPPPPSRASPSVAPPPPPPHHKMAYYPSSSHSTKQNAPPLPNQMGLSNGAPPPPPARIATLSRATGGNFSNFQSEDSDPLEARFSSIFPHIEELPRPPQFGNIPKSYPSKASRQRNPPPPPPTTSSGNSVSNQQSVRLLHIQLDYKMFNDNAISQC